jgi:hypothetical protein
MNFNKEEIRNPTDIINFINYIEAQVKPQKMNFEGIDIWPILKINLYYELSLKILGKSTSNKRKVFFWRVLKSIVSQFKSYKNDSKVLFVSDGISYVNFHNKQYERFCDPLIEELILDGVSCAKWDIAGEIFKEKYFQSKNINGALDFIVVRSMINRFKKDSERNEIISRFCDFINNNTSLINWNYFIILEKIHRIRKMVMWYKKQLDPEKTKLIFIVSYYSERGMALIKACHDLGIKTADIQHGVQGNLHAAYGNWLNQDSKMYYNTIPNSFLVWSKSELEANKNSIIIGNYFESKWYKDDFLVNSFDKQFRSLSNSMKSGKNILFTIQYGIEYKSDFYDLIRATQFDYNWLIRFHPVMTKLDQNEFKTELENKGIINFECDLSTSLPLYTLLRNVNLHVTHSSSTILEAINFNLPSLIIDEFGYEYYSEYVGNAIKFENTLEKQLFAIKELLVKSYIENGIFNENKFKNNFKKYIQSNL